MQTTQLNAPIVHQRHADFIRHAEQHRRVARPRRRRRRMAIVIGGQYFEDGRSGQRGELHRAGA